MKNFLKPVIYNILPDKNVEEYNFDQDCIKERPFVIDKEEYPFKSHWYVRNGVHMHYIDEGEGIPVVLCHGNPEWSFIYRNLVKEMSNECRLIAYDLPGFGFSDKPEDYGYTPQEQVEWMESLIFDHLKLDKFIIVVQDWGGPTGLTLATSHSDHILGTVISNTFAWKSEGTVAFFSYVMRIPLLQHLIINRNLFATKVSTILLNKEARRNKSIVDAFRYPFPTPETRKGPATFPKHVTLAKDWLIDLENNLYRLSDKPVEFIFGTADPLAATEQVQKRWKGHFPNANVEKVPKANHFTQEDCPERFVQALRNILKEIKTK